jgi:predicted nucleic acid-binding protein
MEGAALIIVDTSVWVTHFRSGSPQLERLLLDGQVLCHPFIIGELACGHLRNRKEIISLLQTLPSAQVAENEEVLDFLDSKKLFGTGIGLIDVHLLISALIIKAFLWTMDAKLYSATAKLNIDYRH